MAIVDGAQPIGAVIQVATWLCKLLLSFLNPVAVICVPMLLPRQQQTPMVIVYRILYRVWAQLCQHPRLRPSHSIL